MAMDFTDTRNGKHDLVPDKFNNPGNDGKNQTCDQRSNKCFCVQQVPKDIIFVLFVHGVSGNNKFI
jgi:hypothetical protein